MSDYTPTTEEVRKAYGVLRNSYKIQRFDQEFDRGFMSEFDRWLAEVIREAKNDAWHEGFSAGWDECDEPTGFVNDKWDAKTPSPYRNGENND